MCLAAFLIAGAIYTVWASGLIGGVISPASSSNVAPGAAESNTEAGSPSNSGEVPGPGTAGPPGAQPFPVDDATGTLAERAATLYKEGDYKGAIDLLESSVLEDATDAVAYYQLGLAYLATTDREHAADDAELAFRTAISLQPDWGAPYRLLAETMLRRGFYSEAVEFASRATELDPGQPEAWLTLGHAYEGAGQGAEATRALAEAKRIAPRLPSQP
jgi:Flp pilus assembly protein TadD